METMHVAIRTTTNFSEAPPTCRQKYRNMQMKESLLHSKAQLPILNQDSSFNTIHLTTNIRPGPARYRPSSYKAPAANSLAVALAFATVPCPYPLLADEARNSTNPLSFTSRKNRKANAG